LESVAQLHCYQAHILRYHIFASVSSLVSMAIKSALGCLQPV
jgi:hypothetical protein